jgi:hypothetical protein
MENKHLELAGKYRSTTPGAVDWYYGGGEDSWSSLSDALQSIPEAVRPGKTIGVLISGEVVEYIWHPENTSDGGLVEKYPDDFTDTQVDRLKILVYEDATRSVSRDRSTLEKGLLTDVVFSWSINLRDDTLTTAEFDGTDISGNLSGSQTFNIKDTTSKNLTLIVDRRGSSINLSTSSTSYFYVPQYEGKMSTDEPSASYAGLSSYAKIISSGTNLAQEITLNDEHLFFICRSSSKTPVDNYTNFELSLGEWDSTTAFIIKKPFTITLADGSTESVTLYRTREKKTQTLNISLT